MQVPGSRSGQITGAVFLIGLGILFALGWFWPGILYLLGVTAIVGGATEGKPLSGALQGGVFMIGLGLVFSIGFGLLPLLLVLLGVGLLLNRSRGGFPFSGQDYSERRAARDAAREQRRAWKAQYRSDRHALKDQYRYGPAYVSPEKLKNDQLANDPDADAGDDQDEEFTLGDDGELIKVKNDQRRTGGSKQ